MGSTVLCGKQASAFITKDGTKIYALFEATYEKNLSSRTPVWGCIAFGTYEAVLKGLYGSASICYGGMLQSSRGHIEPGNYLKAWGRELKQPVQLITDEPIELRVGSGISNCLDKSKWNDQREIFLKHQKYQQCEALDNGEKIHLTIDEDLDLLLDLFGAGKGMYAPWRIINRNMLMTLPNQDLAPTITRTNDVTHSYSCYRYKVPYDEIFLLSKDGGPLEIQLDPMFDWITISAYELALNDPAAGINAISTFSDMCKSAPPLPDNTRLHIRVNPDEVKVPVYSIECAQKMKAFANTETAEGSDFCIELNALADSEKGLLRFLKPAQYIVILPEVADVVQTTKVVEQFDMFAIFA